MTKYGLGMLAILAIAGCSSDTDQETRVEERVPVTFQLAKSPISITRAATTTYGDGVWDTGMEVAVKCTQGTEGDINLIKKYVTSNNGSGGFKLEGYNPLNTFYWLDKTDTKSFQFWYPYSAAMPTGMSVDKDQSDLNNCNDAEFASYDLLYAEVSGVKSSDMPVATLSFYHQMALLSVTITSISTEFSDEEVTEVKLGNDDVAVTCSSWTPKASNYTTSGTGAGWTVSNSDKINTVTLRKVSSTNYICILPPQTVGSASTILLSIKTNKFTDHGSKYYTCKGSIDLKAGNITEVEVSITPQEIKLNPTNIVPWAQQTPESLDNVIL